MISRDPNVANRAAKTADYATTAGSANNSGLVKIAEQTVTSSVTEVLFSNVFTNKYNKYRIVMDLTVSGTGAVSLYFDPSLGSALNVRAQNFTNGTTAPVQYSATFQGTVRISNVSATGTFASIVDVFSVPESINSLHSISGFFNSRASGSYVQGFFENTGGGSVLPNLYVYKTNMTGGKITVYGYN